MKSRHGPGKDKESKGRTGKRHNKNSFAAGVAVLTVSNLLVKVTGMLFKIPMNHTVGDVGMGYYNSAYSIYTLFYTLSTAGLPTAVSVMVSENRAAGKPSRAKGVFRLALLVFTVIGLLLCSLMLFASDSLAALIKSEKSAWAIAASSPAILFMCVSSAYRGYFQGCGSMTPTALSQLIEAVVKLVIGVAAALYAVKMGYGPYIAAAYAIMGLTLGSFLGMVYLIIAGYVRGKREQTSALTQIGEREDKRRILSGFLRISLPVTLSATVMSLTNTLDTAMIQRALVMSGMSGESAAALYGNYTSLAVPMFNLPPVFIYPVAYSLVPVVASCPGKIENVRDRIESSLGYAVTVGLPCAMGLSTLADPILCLLYNDVSAHAASPLLTLLAPSSFLVCVLAVTNSVLQGCGREKMPVLSMLAGGAVKLISGAVLLRLYGISGAPYSTFLCYLTATAMNLFFVAKHTGVGLRAGMLIKPLISSVVCVSCAALVYKLIFPRLGNSLSCAAAIASAVVVYAAVLVLTGAVKKETAAKRIRKNNKAEGME